MAKNKYNNYELMSSVKPRSYQDIVANGYRRVINRGWIAVKRHHELRQVISSRTISTVPRPITVIHNYRWNHVEVCD